MPDQVSSRAQADLALAVYLEPHAEGRSVLLLGDAEGVLAERFDRLASQLDIIDPATREPSSGTVPELPFDDRSFDLVLVCDANALPEPNGAALRELRRVLSRTGLLAIVSERDDRRRRRGSAPPGGLEKLLRSEFRNVRVLGQQPIAVSALGELARRGEQDFSVDSTLVKGSEREPDRLLALASESALSAEPRLWVELPGAAPTHEREGQAELIEELRRAEDEAREALHRESDLLRRLEGERKARAQAEQLAERARLFERKLLAAEADYDDAVARVRYLESTIAEREAAATHDRERREGAERELGHAKAELAAAGERVKQVEAARDAAKSEFETAAHEVAELEQRLVEQGALLRELEQDKKRHEQTARDLVEELRRLEHDKSAAVEHDARVAELEAERERAVQRSLEAELAREAAQMRVDELRAELNASGGERRPGPMPGAERARGPAPRDAASAHPALSAELAELRGERHGLALRLEEAERALAAAMSPSAALRKTSEELVELRLRLAHTEAAFDALRAARAEERARPSASDEQLRELEERLAAAERRAHELARELDEARARPSEAEDRSELEDRLASAERRVHELTRELDEARARPSESEDRSELEDRLASAERRVHELTRELDEADRFAEAHAEDADRLNELEAELEQARERIEDLTQVVREGDEALRALKADASSVQSELEHARRDAQRSAAEAQAKVELSERREAERDDARAALAEARSILSQLASRLGGDENDPPSIVQALLARDDSRSSESERMLDELRAELSRRDQRIEQLERRLADARSAEAVRSESSEF